VDAIAEKTRTTKRMIYWYFGSKGGCTPPFWNRPSRHPLDRGGTGAGRLRPDDRVA
jgi:hypothetical protein